MRNRAFLAAIVAIAIPRHASAADLLETFRSAQTNDPVFAAARATQRPFFGENIARCKLGGATEGQ